MPKKLTYEEFVEKLKLIKPNIEVLSPYIGNKKYITVKCTIHNHTWESKPNWLMHPDKYNCQMCYDERRGDAIRIGKEEFVRRARDIFGDQYDYSKVVYKDNQTKVCIICPVHGEFWQKPIKHLAGHHCQKCSDKTLTTEEFIERSKINHNNKYDYSKVDIICPKHGEFWQTAGAHLQGCGCPKCSGSKLEKMIDGIFSKNNINYETQKKFGWLGLQSLDFYLPEYKISIECQGEQHFSSIVHFGNNKRFGVDVTRDIKKNKLCSDNGINLIYITNCDDLILESIENPIFSGIYNENNILNTNNSNFEELLLAKLNII
jgi:hypothetical protein